MCIGPFAPKTATPPPPPAPPKPISVPQDIVNTGTGVDRSVIRRRAALSRDSSTNRTLLSGSLVSVPGSGSSSL